SIVIVGTGALATLFAARLSAAGHLVTMLGSWEKGLSALREDGARLTDEEGVERSFPVNATADPTDCKGARFALVLVKSWQTEHTAKKIANFLAEDGLALTLQNGIGNQALLAKTLGLSRVAQGVTTTGATLLGPGRARVGGQGAISLEAHPNLGPVETGLMEAGFKVQVVEAAQSLIWGKLVVNAAINPLTALLRIPNGEILNRPAAHEIMSALAQETADVASAQGIQLPFENPVKATQEVIRKTADNHSSMYQDVSRGAQTEIDAICGAITKLGEKFRIPTPVNRVCWHLIRASSPSKQDTE
ncbi:MAG: 2-dehydropantoate 2-reductase, partial [Anaerolineae bacterium]|nr:2-dehydropantoate 2-reductase [Anaerolineae bacterium]MDK1117945.1 2-dehydropantoate 2-reductase [Anaerolineae bacterium]